jgi:two-component system response regulator VicR
MAGGQMKRVMVVDDDLDLIYVVKKTLEKNGYEVIGASSGEECLEILENMVPDLILLDIMMPGMDGWDVLKEIRGNDRLKSIPVAMITARSFSRNTVKKRDIKSLLDYVVKPFTKERMTEAQLLNRGTKFFWIDKPFKKEDLLEKVQTIFECVT